MGVILSVGGRKAWFRRGEWRSPDRVLEAELRRLFEDWIAETGGPSLRSADPEGEAAEAVATRAGGRILLRARADARREAREYLNRRQMSLPF